MVGFLSIGLCPWRRGGDPGCDMRKPAGSSPWRPDRLPLTGCTPTAVLSTGGECRSPASPSAARGVTAGVGRGRTIGCQQRPRSTRRGGGGVVARMRSTTSAGSRRGNGGTGVGSGMGITSPVRRQWGRREESGRPDPDTAPAADSSGGHVHPLRRRAGRAGTRRRRRRGVGAALLRPDDEDLCIWRDDADPTLVRVSTDRPADDLDAALALGRELAAETVALSPVGAAVEEVVAMDDEQQLVWRAKP